MYIGIDIGGHKINGVLIQNDKIIRKRRVPTQSKSNKKIMIAQIFDCINYLRRSDLQKLRKKTQLGEVGPPQIKGIGIGAPGPVDFKNQKILNPPNVTALKNLFLATIVQKKFQVETLIENDANCFGLAEARLGAGKKKRIVAGLTLGTGVGGFLIVNKKIFHGESAMATEFGHMNIIKNGRKCSCGKSGCLEAYISARGIMKTAQEVGLKNVSNPKDIVGLAKKGNTKAIHVYKISAGYLGLGLKKIIKKFKPEIIIIGGGVAGAGKFLFAPIKKIITNTEVVKAKFRDDAGAIGAALLFTTYPH